MTAPGSPFAGNHIVQSLWIGPRLSAMERTCIGSFLQNGHRFHLYVYDEPLGVPRGTDLRDAAQILPAASIWVYRDQRTCSGFSNFFRYKLLLERGGWWVDTDTVALRPLAFHTDHVFSSEGINGRRTTTTCMIKAPAGSPVMEYAWQRCQTMDTATLTWGVSGPRLLNEAVSACSFETFVQPTDVFCPIHFSEWRQLLDPAAMRTLGPHVHTVHLWHELWRREGRDKDGCYPRGCLYELLKRRYCFE